MDTETLIKQSLIRLDFLTFEREIQPQTSIVLQSLCKNINLVYCSFRGVTYSLHGEKVVLKVLFESNIFSAALVQSEVIDHINGAG